MALLDKYIPNTEFNSYEDFYKNFTVNIHENFNFAYDIFDALVQEKGDKRALQWCDEKGAQEVFTFAEIKENSDKAANILTEAGIGKGDKVMLLLKRRWEFYPVLLAIHRLGAVAIPSTRFLTAEDIAYKFNAADINGIICADDLDLMQSIDEAEIIMLRNYDFHDLSHLRFKAYIRSIHTPKTHNPEEVVKQRLLEKVKTYNNNDLNDSYSITDGAIVAFGSSHIAKTGFITKDSIAKWTDFNRLMENASHDFKRPEKVNSSDDTMLLCFTQSAAGTPKMALHNFTYPLCHIAAAKYFYQVAPDDLCLTAEDNTWDYFYSQWFCGAEIFVYDYDHFVPSVMPEIISKHKITNFRATSEIYRLLIKEDLRKHDLSSLRNCTSAGDPLSHEIFDQFLNGTGLKLREYYWQMEFGIAICAWQWLSPKAGSIVKPTPEYDIDILREDGSSCAAGEKGEIVIKTDKQKPLGMFNGYYRDETLTMNVWRNNIYYTGNIAWKDEDGYFWLAAQ